MNIAGVVLAGGHGCLELDRSKLVASIDQEPIVRKPVRLLRDYLRLPTFVVTNHRFSDQVKAVLADHPTSNFAVQSERTGTAGAVAACLDVLPTAIKDLVVLYGDMPCWQTESIAGLIDAHRQSDGVITMFRIDLRHEYGQHVANFGRILYDDDGRLVGVFEPYQLTSAELAMAKFVNPSAWVFDVGWLQENIGKLSAHNKGDGFADEYWLPDLVPLALKQNLLVTQVDLPDPREALGVNNPAELEVVRRIFNTTET